MSAQIIAFVMVELGLLFIATCGIAFPWGKLFALGWSEAGSLLIRALTLPLCFFTSFYSYDLYNLRIVRSMFEFRKRLYWPLAGAFSLLVFLSLFTLTPPLAGSMLISSMLLMLLGVGIVLPLRWGLYTFGNVGPFTERVLVLGTGEIAWKVTTAIRSIFPLGYTIAGFVDDGEQATDGGWSIAPIVGHLNRVEQVIEQFRPDRIIVALRERRGRMPLKTLLKAHWAGIVVEDGIQVYERFSGKLAIESLTPGFLIFSTDFKKSKIETLLMRAISLLAALFGLVLSAPLFILIAIIIKIDSKGSVFFVQDRAGLNGRVFRLFKFRTMHAAPLGEEPCSVWNRDLDSRITRVGWWLRMTHLDELPQFFNVLRGDMDIVGPRPEMIDNIKAMERQIPYYALRMAVRPGVTGWAQIKQGYAVSQEEVTEKIRYDLFYIKYRSPWLDCKIIFDTMKLIMFGRENLSMNPMTMQTTPKTVSSTPIDTVDLPKPPGRDERISAA